MAEETLVKEPLSWDMVTAGEALVKRLLEADIGLVCAFWFYTSESNRWKIVFSFPQVHTEGPRRAYETVQRIIKGPEGFSQMPSDFDRVAFFFPHLSNITVLSPKDPLVIAMEKTVRGWPLEPHEKGVRLTSSRVGDVFVEDAFVYRLPQ